MSEHKGTNSDMLLKNGTPLQGGKYIIEKKIGKGGFGITYLAVQVSLNRKVAVKEFFMSTLCSRNEETTEVQVSKGTGQDTFDVYLKKFVKEARTIALLDNPHIIRIIDVFEENNTAYFVMEYLSEGDLHSRIPDTGICEAKSTAYILQIVDALSYIHQHHILHLDVKPANILFKGETLVLIDFGLSKHYDKESGGETSMTPVGISEGYAPLEQYDFDGLKEFSPATDIYALGATFFHLLVGKRPPAATKMIGGLPSLPDGTSQHIIHAIRTAMMPLKGDRPQSIAGFLELLAQPGPSVEESEDTLPPEDKVKDTNGKGGEAGKSQKASDKDDKYADIHVEEKPLPKSTGPNRTNRWYLYGLFILLSILVVAGIRSYLSPTDHPLSSIGKTDSFLKRKQSGTSVRDSLTITVHNGLYGFKNSTGETVIPCTFDYAGPFSDGVASVIKDNIYQYIDKEGNVVLKADNLDYADSFNHGVARFRQNGKWGIMDKTGKPVIQPSYDDLEIVTNNRVLVMKDEKWGIMDTQGTLLTSLNYDFLWHPSEGRFVARRGDKSGFLDMDGREIIPFVYQKVGSFKNGLAVVFKGYEGGLIDLDGNIVLECNYENLQGCNQTEGLYKYTDKGLWGLIDRSGVKVHPQYKDLYGLEDNLIAFTDKNRKKGLINAQGEIIVQPIYDDFYPGNNEHFRVQMNKKRGLMDMKGNVVIPIIYDDLETHFNHDVLEAEKDGKWGLINKQGKTVVPFIYDYIVPSESSESTYREIRVGEKAGVIDVKGNIIIQPENDIFIIRNEGLFRIQKNGKEGIVNAHGETIILFEYDAIGHPYEGLIEVRRNQKWGYIDYHGNEIIPCIYDETGNFDEGIARVKYQGKTLYINRFNQFVDL